MTTEQASVKRIMERAQALKQRLSNASDHSAESFEAYGEEKPGTQSVPENYTNGQDAQQESQLNMPLLVAKQPEVEYHVKEREPRLLMEPIQDLPFMCLMLISNLKTVDNLTPLSPTGIIKDVHLRINANPAEPTKGSHILFDFQQIEQLSLALVADDGEQEFVLAAVPLFNAEELLEILVNPNGKRKYSRKCISLAFKETVYLKSTAQSAESIGSLTIAVADVVLLCGGSKLLEFESVISASPTCVHQFLELETATESIAIQTDELSAESPNPMHEMRKIAKIEVVLRVGGVCVGNEAWDELESVYISSSLEPDAKFEAAVGLQPKFCKGVPEDSTISKQFPLFPRNNVKFSDLCFNIGKTLTLTPDIVSYLSKGSVYVAVFGKLKSGRKAYLGCAEVGCSSNESNWIGFVRGGGYIYCDVEIIRGNDMCNFVSYEKLIEIKGLPAEYEMMSQPIRQLGYHPFIPTIIEENENVEFLYSREINPQISRVAPLRDAAHFDNELGSILNVGRHIDELFEQDE